MQSPPRWWRRPQTRCAGWPRPGWLRPGQRVAEYGSPHGGSWLPLLTGRGLTAVGDGEPADVVLDCFGLMHAADQAAAMAARAARVAPGGVLLLQYHSLEAIITGGQWNALRHGHYAYYSTTALTPMLARAGFSPRTAWRFGLYGGTVLLAARRDADGDGRADGAVDDLLASEAHAGVTDPAVLRGLGDSALARASGLHDWLAAEKRGRPPGARVRGRLARGRPAAPVRRGPPAAARGGRRLAGQAGPAHAGHGHPGDQPRPSWPRTSRPRWHCSCPTCCPRSGRRTRRSRRQAAAGWMRTRWPARRPAQEACSRTRSRSRQRPRVGPMLPTGRPSWSEISVYDAGGSAISMLEQPLPAGRQARQRGPDGLGALLRQQPFVDRRAVGLAIGQGLLRHQHDALARREAAQALVPGRGGQPGAHPGWVVEPVDVLEQAQPRGLEHVRGIALDQLEIPGHRPDQPGVLVEQALPGQLVPVRRAPDDLGYVPGGRAVGLGSHCGPPGGLGPPLSPPGPGGSCSRGR